MTGCNPKPAHQFSQGGAFVVGLMTQPGVDVVSDYGEVGNFSTVFDEILMNDVRVIIVSGDKAKRRVGVLVNPRMETGADPFLDPWDVRSHEGKDFRMGSIT